MRPERWKVEAGGTKTSKTPHTRVHEKSFGVLLPPSSTLHQNHSPESPKRVNANTQTLSRTEACCHATTNS